jgi:hypothetical protein
MLRFAITLASLFAIGSPLVAAPKPTTAPGHAQLVNLFTEWRAFNHPAIVNGRPDYGAAAMAAKAERLPAFQQRLRQIDRSGWSVSEVAITAWSKPK